MPLNARINREGSNKKVVLTGPGELVGPSSQAKVPFSGLTGITGAADVYEVTDGSGTGAGAYTVTVKPYSILGFRASHRGVGRVALLKQTNGTGAFSVVGIKAPRDGNTSVVVGPVSCTTTDRLVVIVERKSTSALRYRLELDKS